MTEINVGGRSRPTFVTSLTSDEIAGVFDLVQKVSSFRGCCGCENVRLCICSATCECHCRDCHCHA